MQYFAYKTYIDNICTDEYMTFFADPKAISAFFGRASATSRLDDIDIRFRRDVCKYRDLGLNVIEIRNGMKERFGEAGGNVSEFTLEELLAELIFCAVHERMYTGFFRECCETGYVSSLLIEIQKRRKAL